MGAHRCSYWQWRVDWSFLTSLHTCYDFMVLTVFTFFLAFHRWKRAGGINNDTDLLCIAAILGSPHNPLYLSTDTCILRLWFLQRLGSHFCWSSCDDCCCHHSSRCHWILWHFYNIHKIDKRSNHPTLVSLLHSTQCLDFPLQLLDHSES